MKEGRPAPGVNTNPSPSITGPTINQPGFPIYDKVANIEQISRRFPYRAPLLRQEVVYYSEGQLRESTPSE